MLSFVWSLCENNNNNNNYLVVNGITMCWRFVLSSRRVGVGVAVGVGVVGASLRVVVRRYCHSTTTTTAQHNTTITTTDKYMHTRNCSITLVCNRYRLRFVWMMSNFESKIVWLFIYDWWLLQIVWNNKLYTWLSKTILYHRLVSVMAQIELNKWVMDKWIVKILRSDRLL